MSAKEGRGGVGVTPYYADPLVTLHLGDCLEVMAALDAESVDAVCTDPPYLLGFMGRQWDTKAAHEHLDWHGAWAAACYRLLKPGGHLLAFGGTRTYHRMVVAIEDAGFEIRDCLVWAYASGFPKSLDVSKSLDKRLGAERAISRPAARSLVSGEAISFDQRSSTERERRDAPVAAAAAAAGWGTALKPAWEPIVMARKPLVGSVADNWLEHGTGALNIDGCRIPLNGEAPPSVARRAGAAGTGISGWNRREGRNHDAENYARERPGEQVGRWPSNVLLSDPELFDEPNPYVVGSGARFFIVPKADRAERERGLAGRVLAPGGSLEGGKDKRRNATNQPLRANHHPTVKPIDLMRHLVRLVTPTGGTVLDPFLGSGTTALAASEEGFHCIGIEREPEYLDIAKARLIATPMGFGLSEVPA